MNPPAVIDPDFLFAEDLMHFVMQGYDLPFSRTPTFMRTAPVRFVPCVGHVVRYLTSLQEDKTLYAFDRLRTTILSGEHFNDFASGMAEEHFRSGDFHMLDFLSFCAQITRLAVLFYSNNVTDAPVMTVQVVRNALQKERLKFVSCGSWDKLYDLCFYVLHRVPRRQRCKSPKFPIAAESQAQTKYPEANCAEAQVRTKYPEAMVTEAQVRTMRLGSASYAS